MGTSANDSSFASLSVSACQTQPNGCVCKPGYFGQNCQNSPASSAVVSAALVVVLALAALFVNL